ncbi:MAG: TIGR00341 family protein [Planctomycetales bacterium]
MHQFFERLAKSGIPQLDRTQRVALFERAQSNSRWDTDFMLLTCLSTLIAALGLVQNSAAVVIGAMLVAPLMTPLIAAGLSLVQGNMILIRNAVRSISRGFAIAFTTGIAVGVLTPNLSVTPEMLARGSPRMPDLLVAFISGVAAAYAMGRPNLFSALPGVAIAAALVPPLATAGLATSLGRWQLASGSLLLFLTNIVSIVLGAACALWVVGIRGQHEYGGVSRWARFVSVSLILVAMGLAVYEVWPRFALPKDLYTAIEHRVELQPDTELIDANYEQKAGRPRVNTVLASPQQPDKRLADDLFELLAEQCGENVQIRLETRLTTVVER